MLARSANLLAGSLTTLGVLRSGALELGILFHQLLQAEAWKLYRNLGFFAFSFALVDRPFAIFRMPYPLPRTKAALACRLLDGRRFPDRELFAASREEL